MEIRDGEWVVREGDSGDALYVVLEGEAVVEQRTAADDDRPQLIEIIGTGGIFGELSFIDGRPRAASVRARGPLRVMAISRAEFEETARREPAQAIEMTTMLLGLLSERVRESSRTMAALLETGRRLGRAVQVDDLAAAVIERIEQAIPVARAAVVALAEPGASRFAPIVGFGLRPGVPAIPIDAGGELARVLAERPEGVRLGPADRFAEDMAFAGRQWSLVSGIAYHGELIGLVGVFADAPTQPFTPAHQLALAIIASLAAPAFSRVQVPKSGGS